MKVFEYIILHRIKAKKDSQGNDVPEKLEIVQDLKRAVAKDERVMAMMAAKEIPSTYDDKLDEVEIAIRPF